MKKMILLMSMAIAFVSCQSDKVITILEAEESTPIQDVDGNEYKTVKVGSQIWMAENLRTTHFADGRVITKAPDGYVTSKYPESYQTGATYMDRDTAVEAECGLYYNWPAAVDAEHCVASLATVPLRTQGICPKGWRVPTIHDWEVLCNNLGGMKIAGNSLKSTMHWNLPNEGTTNASKLSMIPAAQYIDGFDLYGYYALYWAADEGDTWSGRVVYIGYQSGEVVELNNAKTAGVCIRCMMDDEE